MKGIRCIILKSLLFQLFYAGAQTRFDYNDYKPNKGPVSIDVGNPLFGNTKFRGQIEYRTAEKTSLLDSLTYYHSNINPGVQAHLEYRYFYSTIEPSQFFFYGKAGYGNSFTYNGWYALLGAGLGQQIYFGTNRLFFYSSLRG
jgi:hypothetical protein